MPIASREVGPDSLRVIAAGSARAHRKRTRLRVVGLIADLPGPRLRLLCDLCAPQLVSWLSACIIRERTKGTCCCLGEAVGQVSASELGAALAVRSSTAWWRRVSGRLSLAD